MEIKTVRPRLSAALLIWIALPCVALLILTGAPSTADATPRVVKATKTQGIKRVGSLRTAARFGQVTLWDAKQVFGKPKLIRRPYRELCEAYFGNGLGLSFATFGLPGSCYDRYLQGGLIRTRHWEIKIGKRTYRAGMHKRRIPRNARFYRHYGYQLASMRFMGRRTGTVFAKLGGKNRIRAFSLFFGMAGD